MMMMKQSVQETWLLLRGVGGGGLRGGMRGVAV